MILNKYLLKLNGLLKNRSIHKVLLRRYGRVYSKDFEVDQFCSVQVNCPYSINIRPIDVFQAQGKVVVNLEADGENTIPNIRCEKNGDTVFVEGKSCENENQNTAVRLNVETSVKASIKVTGDKGPITIGSFYGKYIDVNSSVGDILLSKSQCEWISATSKGGSITCDGILQAADIKLKTEQTGSITTGRVQGLKLQASTTSGNISTGSTYCDNTKFKTDFGSMRLQNVHKNVAVDIDHEGLLNISGFDGTLIARINKGLVDIQLSRVIENSLIFMKDSGTLILRLSDECQENTGFKVLPHNYVLAPTVKMEATKSGDLLLLEPMKGNKAGAHVVVDCKNSHVLIGASSWSDMFQANTNYKT